MFVLVGKDGCSILKDKRNETVTQLCRLFTSIIYYDFEFLNKS